MTREDALQKTLKKGEVYLQNSDFFRIMIALLATNPNHVVSKRLDFKRIIYKILMVQLLRKDERSEQFDSLRRVKNERRREFLENIDFFDIMYKRNKNWGIMRDGIL